MEHEAEAGGAYTNERISDLIGFTKALGGGDFSYRATVSHSDDPYDALANEMNSLAEKLEAQAHEREQTANELRASEAQARQLAKGLERSNRELQDFTSAASHDLRAPLRKVESFVQLVAKTEAGSLGTEGRDYLERIGRSVRRMQRLIDRLLELASATSRPRQVELVDLSDTMREVRSDLASSILETGAELELGELPEVRADPIQMVQLLENLVENSLKFHRADVTPIVRISGRLTTAEQGADTLCEIIVEDNGMGFRPDQLDRMFEAFQRLDEGRYRDGSGVGLAVCRKIVERHGGEITARSTPGKGSTFIVTLPGGVPVPRTSPT